MNGAKLLYIIIIGFYGLEVVRGDIYLHNPRGSNNRLDEQTHERANNNRMFDSENNARGAYNVGNLYYAVGSMHEIEW